MNIRDEILRCLAKHTQDRAVHDACINIMGPETPGKSDKREPLVDSNGIGIRALVTMAENYDVFRKLYADNKFRETMSETHLLLFQHTIDLGNDIKMALSKIIDNSKPMHEDDIIESLVDFERCFEFTEQSYNLTDEMKKKLKTYPHYVLCGVNILSYPDMVEGMLCIPRNEQYCSETEKKMLAKVYRATKNWR